MDKEKLEWESFLGVISENPDSDALALTTGQRLLLIAETINKAAKSLDKSCSVAPSQRGYFANDKIVEFLLPYKSDGTDPLSSPVSKPGIWSKGGTIQIDQLKTFYTSKKALEEDLKKVEEKVRKMIEDE